MQAMKRITTEGALLTGQKGPAIAVPFDPSQEWGTREEPLGPDRQGHPVEVDLNGVRFRSAIVSRMSRFFVLVDEAMARRAGAEVGDKVKVTVWPASMGSPTDMVRMAAKPSAAAPKKRKR
jgi:Domain of unknown function (DUF1905)